MKNWLKEHINAILGTILAHLIIVFVALLLKINTSVEHSETQILIDTELLLESDKEINENIVENEEMINIDEYMSNLTSAGSNYQAVPDNLKNNQDLSVDEIRQMYEEEILREKYGNEYENHVNDAGDYYVTPYALPDKKNKEIPLKQNIDNTNRPCLVKAVLDDPSRLTRYLHIPVFTCQGSGVIEIAIIISPEGKVTSSKLLSATVGADKECLVEAAISASQKSRFAIVTTKQNQSGKIIYNFVNQ